MKSSEIVTLCLGVVALAVGVVSLVQYVLPDHPLPPDEAIAECIRAGRFPQWKANAKEQSFTCEPAQQKPTPKMRIFS